MDIRLGNRAARVIGNAFEINERLAGDKAYRVTANDGSSPMDFIIYAKSFSEAREEAELSITSKSLIEFKISYCDFELRKPNPVRPSWLVGYYTYTGEKR